jgi:hypothetical protein
MSGAMREALDLVAQGRRMEARRTLRLAGLSVEEAAAWVVSFDGRPAFHGILGPLDT